MSSLANPPSAAKGSSSKNSSPPKSSPPRPSLPKARGATRRSKSRARAKPSGPRRARCLSVHWCEDHGLHSHTQDSPACDPATGLIAPLSCRPPRLHAHSRWHRGRASNANLSAMNKLSLFFRNHFAFRGGMARNILKRGSQHRLEPDGQIPQTVRQLVWQRHRAKRKLKCSAFDRVA